VNQNRTYHGARATMDVHDPQVGPDQFTMAQIWVQNGPTPELNSIQAGWAVSDYLNFNISFFFFREEFLFLLL
jgi:hypothetical protein